VDIEPRDSAVVDHFAGRVAPGRVQHLSDAEPFDIARDHAVEQTRRVRAVDVVFEQRRDIEERGAVSDRPIFTLVRKLVGACGQVARPAAPDLGRIERLRAWVKRRAREHGRSPVDFIL